MTVDQHPATNGGPPPDPQQPSNTNALILYAPPPPPPSGFGGKVKEAGSWVQDYVTAIKNGRFHPFTKTERKARAATRNQSWGPTGAELNELARLSYNPVDCSIIFGVIEFRLGYPPKRWRNVYKGLSLLEFIIKRGSDNAVTRAKDLMRKLESLTSFAYISSDGKDVGDNVRHRSRAIHALLSDDERLKAERAASAKLQSQIEGAGIAGSGGGGYGDTAQNATASQQANSLDATNAVNGTSSSSSFSLPNAGETKGVTLEENKRYIAALKRLMARPENRLCADCALPGPGQRPTWASITCGVFICMRCAGAHRSLGTHISKVRSCSLDTWLPSQIAFLAGCGGNTTANAYWEARLPATGKPAVSSGPELEAFARRKYVDRAYALPDGEWPPTAPFEDPEILEILDDILSDDEKAERAAAIEAAKAAADAADVAGPVEEETAAVIIEEEQQVEEEEEVKPSPAPLPDLINLMDFDIEPTLPAENTISSDNNETQQEGNKGLVVEEEELNPLQALENMFLEPQAPAPLQNPFAQHWDMGAVLHQQHQEAALKQQQEQEAAAQAHAQALQQQYNQQQQRLMQPTLAPRSTYLPPWAPQPHVTLPNTMQYNSPESVAAATIFTAGFSGVPHQFTAGPVLPAPPFPITINPNNNTQVGNNSNEQGQGQQATYNQQQQQHQQQRVLSSHEILAQKVMSGGLDSFKSHAELIAVKSPPRLQGAPTPPQAAMKNSPGKGFTPPPPQQQYHQQQQHQQYQYQPQQVVQQLQFAHGVTPAGNGYGVNGQSAGYMPQQQQQYNYNQSASFMNGFGAGTGVGAPSYSSNASGNPF